MNLVLSGYNCIRYECVDSTKIDSTIEIVTASHTILKMIAPAGGTTDEVKR